MKGIRDWLPGEYPLNPLHSGQVSFRGKARVRVGLKGDLVLYSYDTPVAWIDARGEFHRLWRGWSVTTHKHVQEFIQQYAEKDGPPPGGPLPFSKAHWEKLDVDDVPDYIEFADS